MRRTKIVCTIGPASESPEMVARLLTAGMNVARLNFSHGTHEEHGRRIKVLQEESERAGTNLAVLLDTKGPEIRTGMVPDKGIELIKGSKLILDISKEIGSTERVSITYENLWQEVEVGTHILVDDGLLDLEVINVSKEKIETTVCNGGILKSQKGVNAPGVNVQLPALTPKDVSDIKFGLENGIDFIAASFARKASDILEVRKIVEEAGASVKIIAKIENREGLKNLREILEVSDGIMVARGDLGVEIPVEEVPIHQKEIIALCNEVGKPVVVATQMLDSMMRQPRPTRAEASDVANAILDGADAIMLSGETAAGSYPVEAVKTMDKIAKQTEQILFKTNPSFFRSQNIAEAIGHASNTIANDLNAAAIITPTQSGVTSRMISRFRPKSLIIAATPYEATARSLALNWGVHSLIVPMSTETDQLLTIAVTSALTNNLVKTGDIVVLTAGVPVGETGTTNMIKVQVVGNVLARGTGIGKDLYSGIARRQQSLDQFNKGDILIASYTDAEINQFLAKAGAIVAEEGGLTSNAAIAALQYGIPAVVGADQATEKIKDGQSITVDAFAGVVYEGIVKII